MTLDDLTETFRSKLNSPVFFPLLFAFVALNWRALLFLFHLEGGIEQKIAAFDDRTSWCSLLLLPILLSAAITVSVPYLRLGLEWLTRFARRQKRIADDRENQLIEEKRLEGEIKNAGKKAKLALELQQVDRTLSTFQTEEGRRNAANAITTPNKDKGTPDSDNNQRVSGTAWFLEKSKTNFTAVYEKAKSGKPEFIVAFDSAAPENGGLDFASRIFFKFQDTRDLVEKHFALRLLDLQEEALKDREIGEISTEEPIYVLRSNDGNFIKSGRLYQNSDEALKIVRNLVKLVSNEN